MCVRNTKQRTKNVSPGSGMPRHANIQTYYATCEHTGKLVFPIGLSLAEILVLVCTAGAGGMAPPASTRISARMKRVQENVSPANMDGARPLMLLFASFYKISECFKVSSIL